MLSGMGRDGLTAAAAWSSAAARCSPRTGTAPRSGACRAASPRRPRLGGAAAGRARPPSRRARRERAHGNKRLRPPHPRQPARGAHRPAARRMNRRWRIDTALGRDHARARLRHARPARRARSSPARDRALADAGGRGAAQQRDLFLPRPAAVRPAARRPGASGSSRRAPGRSGCRSGAPAARPARKPIRWR